MKKLRVLFVIAIVFALTLLLFGCGGSSDPPADAPEAEFDDPYVQTEDDETALVYSPRQTRPSFGLIFYVGTAIAPKNYAYLGEALARHGYLAVFPKTLMNFAFYQYKQDEVAFERFGDVRFFLGGHSQGGGAAIRRAQENADRTLGLILFAPLCYTYSGGVFTGAGEDFYSVADKPIPSLILEASADRVLNSAQKGAVLNCADISLAEQRLISPGAHMSFSMMDADAILRLFNRDGDGITAEQKDAQRAAAAEYALAFMDSVSATYAG